MTPKERAAMQQALEALRLAKNSHGIMLMSDPPKDAWRFHDVDLKLVAAITALREALAEQTEQEPKYFGLTHDHTWLSIDKKQYDKLKPEGRMACYAAPVRTKDLTDDEIASLWDSDGFYRTPTEFARAVIQEFRRKNGIV